MHLQKLARRGSSAFVFLVLSAVTFGTARAQQAAVPHSIGGNVWIPADRPDFISYKGNTCAAAYDVTGANPDNCLIRNAMQWIVDNSPAGSYYGLEFPVGRTRLSSNGYTAAISTPVTSPTGQPPVTARISMRGASNGSAVLAADAGAGSVIGILGEGDCHGAPGDCDVVISNLAIVGQGRNSTGDGLEIINTTHVHVVRVTISEFNGKCLNVQGNSERNAFEDGSSEACQSSVNMSGDTNEVLFSHWDATQLGQEDGTNYCYGSVNCTNGALNTSSQNSPAGWGVDPKSAVHLDGDRIEWHASSIKGTAVQGGLSSLANTALIYETYIEGFPYSNQPRTAAAIQVGGKLPISVLSRAIGTADLTVPVTNTSVQWLYSQDPAHAPDVCCHAARNIFQIYPKDYLPGSTAASAFPAGSGPAITRGTVESISVNAFSGDGAAHLASRGAPAFAWPAGSIIELFPIGGGYGTTRLISNHINSLDPLTYSDHTGSNPNYFLDSCSDYTLLAAPAQGSTSAACGEILVGFVPDGYSIQAPGPNFYLPYAWNVELADNSIYTGPGGSLDGQGFVKVMANGAVSFSPGDDAPLNSRRFDPAGIANGVYTTGAVNVAFGNWSGILALGSLTDPGAGIIGWRPGAAFSGKFYDPLINGTLATELLGGGNQCTYSGATATNPGGTSRLCMFPGGVAQDSSTDGNTWVNDWVDNGGGLTTNKALILNSGTKANGTAGFTGTCTSPKSPVVVGGIVTGCQ